MSFDAKPLVIRHFTHFSVLPVLYVCMYVISIEFYVFVEAGVTVGYGSDPCVSQQDPAWKRLKLGEEVMTY